MKFEIITLVTIQPFYEASSIFQILEDPADLLELPIEWLDIKFQTHMKFGIATLFTIHTRVSNKWCMLLERQLQLCS